MKTLLLMPLLSSLVSAPSAPPIEKRPPPPRVEAPGSIASAGRCVPTPGDQRLELRFQGAPLEDLVKEVARHTCRDLVLAPRDADVRIGVYSGGGITAERLWPAFLEILAAHDFTIVEGPSYTVIAPSADATRLTLPMIGAKQETPSDGRMVTKLLRPKTKDLNALANYLNIYKSSRGQVHPYAPAGVLVISDYGPVVQKLERMVDQLE